MPKQSKGTGKSPGHQRDKAAGKSPAPRQSAPVKISKKLEDALAGRSCFAFVLIASAIAGHPL